MKRFFVTAVVLLVTVGVVAYFFAQAMAQGSQNNYFNQNIRPKISASPFWRGIFVFKDYGDAKRDYLKAEAKIRFSIYLMEGVDVDSNMLDQMVEEIKRLTRREAAYRIVTAHIPYNPSVNNAEKEAILKKYEFGNNDGYSDVYVFILSEDETEPELIGTTVEQNSMIIFYDAIHSFTGRNQNTTPLYVLSTILHEFAHLLSMEHTAESGCLMLEHAEEDHVPKIDPDDVIVSFCESELKQIRLYSNPG